jgi:hypothetical protein
VCGSRKCETVEDMKKHATTVGTLAGGWSLKPPSSSTATATTSELVPATRHTNEAANTLVRANVRKYPEQSPTVTSTKHMYNGQWAKRADVEFLDMSKTDGGTLQCLHVRAKKKRYS